MNTSKNSIVILKKNTKGYDQISIKMCKNVITKHLAFIINQTIRTGCYPDKLKIVRMRPLSEKGENTQLKIVDQYAFCLLFI